MIWMFRWIVGYLTNIPQSNAALLHRWFIGGRSDVFPGCSPVLRLPNGALFRKSPDVESTNRQSSNIIEHVPHIIKNPMANIALKTIRASTSPMESRQVTAFSVVWSSNIRRSPLRWSECPAGTDADVGYI